MLIHSPTKEHLWFFQIFAITQTLCCNEYPFTYFIMCCYLSFLRVNEVYEVYMEERNCSEWFSEGGNFNFIGYCKIRIAPGGEWGWRSQCKNYLQAKHVPHPETFIYFHTSPFSLPRRHGLPVRLTALIRPTLGREGILGSGVLKEKGDGKPLTLRSRSHNQFALMSLLCLPNPLQSCSQQKYCLDPRGLWGTNVLSALLLKIPGSASG